MVIALFYVAAARTCSLTQILASHYDLSWAALRYCGYMRTLSRYYNLVQTMVRSGGDGGNGGDEEQAEVSILSEGMTNGAGEAVLRQEATQRARTRSSASVFVLNDVIMHHR